MNSSNENLSQEEMEATVESIKEAHERAQEVFNFVLNNLSEQRVQSIANRICEVQNEFPDSNYGEKLLALAVAVAQPIVINPDGEQTATILFNIMLSHAADVIRPQLEQNKANFLAKAQKQVN